MSRARADQLVAQLKAADVAATVDPRAVPNLAPCVLVPPPARDLSGRTVTWTLAAVSAQANGSLAAWDDLDDLVANAVLALDGLVEAARPANYTHTPGADPLPAYLLTITESE